MTLLTILMPCLNEAETLATCIRKAHQGVQATRARDSYEILIADNGSTDGSQEIATDEGARVIHVPKRGYGAALQTGIENACGEYVLMGDSDDSYDFSHIAPFIDALDQGYDLVMGTRLRGKIMPGAMPFLHQYLGNPVLTFIGNLLFKVNLSDFHCGMRAFRRDALLALNLKTKGMEYASEMVIQSALANLKRTEVPVTLYPDGRSRPPHLRTWRDGWRHLRFMLLYSPRWVFFYPALFLMIIGGLTSLILLLTPVNIGGVVLDVHSLLISMTLSLSGLQLLLFGILARSYASRIGILPKQPRLERFLDHFTLGAGMTGGVALSIIGILLYAFSFVEWAEIGFSAITNYRTSLRVVILGTGFLIAGLQIFFGSFIVSLFNLNHD